MLRQAGYLQLEDLVLDLNHKPIAVSSCGHYRLLTLPSFHTLRPQGRQDWQMIYLKEGAITLKKNGTIHRETAPCLVLYAPGEPQDYGYELADAPDVYWLHFGGNRAKAILSSLGLLPSQSPRRLPRDKGVFTLLWERILTELQLRRPHFELLIDGMLSQLLCELARALSQGEERRFSPTVEEALKQMHRSYASPLSPGDYARRAGMSQSGFCHRFRRETGVSPGQYLQTLRLNSAKELLNSTKLSISEIAAQVGYTDPLYFSRLFCQREGTSPTEYRKQNRS